MKNSIDVRVEFSFKGVDYAPTATIDLDLMMERGGELADLYSFLARQHNIDTYSYLYDAMESHDICFDKPTGLASRCFSNGIFDQQAFERLWFEEKEMQALKDIAKRHLKIDDIRQHPEVMQALLSAYQAGKAQR